MREGGVKNPEKLPTSFMDGPFGDDNAVELFKKIGKTDIKS